MAPASTIILSRSARSLVPLSSFSNNTNFGRATSPKFISTTHSIN
nr:MAG TPA: hypothetical protein [Caudoviricetes sp.]